MTIAKFLHKNGRIVGFRISDHTGYAAEGEDIVCASVSSAVQMAANTLTEALKINAKVTTSEALVSLDLPEIPEKSWTESKYFAAEAVLNGMHMHFKLLSEDFRGYIRIEDLEV